MAFFATLFDSLKEAVSTTNFLDQAPPPQPPPRRRQGPKRVAILDPNYRRSLVETMTRLIKLKRNLDQPNNTGDLVVEMMSINLNRGNNYIERVWWVQTNHPLVPFIETVIHTVEDTCWERLDTLGSDLVGRVHVYTDETIMGMMHELFFMFKEQGMEMENFLPPLEEDDDEYEEQEEEQQEQAAMDEVVIHLDGTMTEKRNPVSKKAD